VNLFEINHSKHVRIIENTDKIIAMHNEGKKTTDIAKLMGVSHATIYGLLIKKGIIESTRKKRILYSHKEKVEHKNLKPFMERISPELRAAIKRNTEINNTRIKTYSNPPKDEEDRELELVDNIIEMPITDVATKTRSRKG